MNHFFEPQKFLDPEKTLFAAGLTSGQTLIDLGAGSGFYAIAAGKIVGEQGSVVAVDVLETALDHIAAEARLKGLRNVKTIHTNLEEANSCSKIDSGTMDYVLLANLTHQIKNKKRLFEEAYRLLKTGGRLIVLEWNEEPSRIGPIVAERIDPSEIKKLAKEVTLREAGLLPTDHYHYGLMFIK